jgi:enoyl-CoA hydratase
VSSDHVRYEPHDGVAVITLDDGKANALSPALITTINAALDRAEQANEAVVLCGRPGRFCAGFDLNVMSGGLAAMRALVTAGAELVLRLYTFPRPVVVACTGHALAAGAVMLLSADLRIGARGEFKLGLNEVAIQLPLPVFAMELARDRLSKRHFVQAVSQARIYDPVDACDAGYLDQAVEPPILLDTALGHARRLAALPDHAFRATKDRERRGTVARIRATLTEDIAQLTTPG